MKLNPKINISGKLGRGIETFLIMFAQQD